MAFIVRIASLVFHHLFTVAQFGIGSFSSRMIWRSMTFVPVGPVMKWLRPPDRASSC